MIIDPSSSIDIAIAQKQELQYQMKSINNYQDVQQVIQSVLVELGAENLFNSLSDIKILIYPYQFVSQDQNGITMIYSFAVLEGTKGDTLDDKMILNPQTLGVINKIYTLPEDAPFIVLGKVNENDPKYFISSIAHEISHILIDYVEDNQNLISKLSEMVPANVETIEKEEALSIIFEIKVLKQFLDGQEIMKYLIDRYLVDYQENPDLNEGYIKEFRALVSVT